MPITVRRGFATKRLEATLVKYGTSSLKPIATSLGRRPYVSRLPRGRLHENCVYNRAVMPIPKGVLIADVQKDSKAAKLGLFTHDIITQVNDRR